MAEPVLSVIDVEVVFDTDRGQLDAVRGVSLALMPEETLAVVGESGSGKSALALAIVGLLPDPPGRVRSGQVMLAGANVLDLSLDEFASIRGRDVGFIFQDPMVSLNPVMKVGRQIIEALRVHDKALSVQASRSRVMELLSSVGLPDPESTFDRYPHELSGGMRQRILIAIAIANNPPLIIADEPTTALDVTVQAQVMQTLKQIQQNTGSALLLISHDLGLVADIADRVLVMYAGRIVEQGSARTVLKEPLHPYTAGLLASAPTIEMRGERLPVITGSPPSPYEVGDGCAFQPRCGRSKGRPECATLPPLVQSADSSHWVACHFADEVGSASDIGGWAS